MMIVKRIIHILPILPLLAVFLSCSQEVINTENRPPAETRSGLLSFNVTASGAQTPEKIRTVRFIVFDHPSPSEAILDVNELFTVPQNQQDAVVFNATLKVKHLDSKIVFVIANEPDGMTKSLSAITSMAALENLTLEFSRFLNYDYTTLEKTGMPMTGAVWVGTDHGYPVYNSQGEAEQPANHIPLQIARAVARIDVYLEVGKDQTVETRNRLTTATLKNTYDESYFVMGTEFNHTRNNTTNPGYNIGKVRTLNATELANTSRSVTQWKSNASNSMSYNPTNPEANRMLFCSFYTPERTCSAANHADKLVLDVNNIIKDQIFVNGSFTFEEMYKKGKTNPQKLSLIERNNVYCVVFKTQKDPNKPLDGIAAVVDWYDIPINAAIEGQKSLSVSQLELNAEYRIKGDHKAKELQLKSQNTAWKATIHGNPACNTSSDVVKLNTTTGGKENGVETTLLQVTPNKEGVCYLKFQSTSSRLWLLVKVNVEKEAYASRFALTNVLSTDAGKTLTFATSYNDLKPKEEGGKGLAGNMQGLFFKWGSLVALSGMGGNAQGKVHLIYHPTGKTSTTFSAIPYAREITKHYNHAGLHPNVTYGTELEAFEDYYNGMGYDEEDAKGDVCKYISDKGWVEGKWKMPNVEDFVELWKETPGNKPIILARGNDWVDKNYGLYETPYGVFVGKGAYPGIADGAQGLKNAQYPPPGAFFFPAGGWITFSADFLGQGQHGDLWAATSFVPKANSRMCYELMTDLDKFSPNTYSDREKGIPVRCIRVD